MFRRFSAALAAGRRAAAASGGQQPPESAQSAKAPATRALVHFGDAGAVGPRLLAHRAFCLRQGVRCLLLSDDIPQLCVGSREILFEFVPRPARTALSTPGGHAAAVDHSFRRIGQIFSFWQVIGCDWEGERAQDLLGLAPDWAHPVVLAGRIGKGNASQHRALVLG